MSKETEVAEIVGALALAFTNAKVPERTIRIYIQMLLDIPTEVLRVTAEQCLAECEFFPTIAAIRDRALKLTLPVRVDPLEAWGQVRRAISQYGFYRSPSFDDSITAKAVDSLGWQYLCVSENPVADRAHFSKIYEQLARREIQEARLLPRARELREQAQGVKEISDGVH